ncbi:response regulator [Sinorhizobium sp. Sb3]|uniref:response regulator transcription factor n=2 Tax=Ensifer TaxID=106591 RepID=UPI0009E76402
MQTLVCLLGEYNRDTLANVTRIRCSFSVCLLEGARRTTTRPLFQKRLPRMSGSRAKIVAIIDDDRNLRLALQDLLETVGIIGEVYKSAEDFISREGFRTADCILTDLRMPGMSGLELLRMLRTQGHKQPVLIMTSYADADAEASALKGGASEFLSKPLNSDRLIRSIRQL